VKKKLYFISGESLSPEIFYDYIDLDPVVPIRIIASKISKKHLAFLDTGSDGIAIPKELWAKFKLSNDYPVRIQSVTGLSWSYIDTQKKKIWNVRPGVRKIKAIVDALWASAKKAKTISKSYIHDLLRKFGRYPDENKRKNQRNFDEFNSELIALVEGTTNIVLINPSIIKRQCRSEWAQRVINRTTHFRMN
jgi:hypothetical protein